MRYPGTSLAILAAMGCVCSGLLVGPVRLANNTSPSAYITYVADPSPENSSLECPYQLEDESEVVQEVSWKLWEDEQEVGSFKWQPDVFAQATGRLDGVVNLERTDGSLELTTLRYDLRGYYSCAVTLTTGKKIESAKFETVIIDTTTNHATSSSYNNEQTCELEVSYSIFSVFPEPTVHAGMYSASRGGYYDEVTGSQWFKIVSPNNAVAYSFDKRHFKIDANTPEDAQFMLEVSVIKDDGTKIPLHTSSLKSSIWTQPGCPEVKVGEDQKVKYSDSKFICSGVYSPDVLTKIAKAVVSCAEGYHADGSVTSVEMFCTMETLTWSTEQNQKLMCVMDLNPVAMDLNPVAMDLNPVAMDLNPVAMDVKDPNMFGGGDGDGGASCLPSLAIPLSAFLLSRLLL